MARLTSLAIILFVVSVTGSEEGWVLGEPICFRAPATLKIGQSEFDFYKSDSIESFVNWSKPIPSRGSNSRSIERRDGRGLHLIGELARRFLLEESDDRKASIRAQLIELADSLANNHRKAIPHYVDLVQTPILLAHALDHPVGRGTKAAADIPISFDGGQIDPPPSTFWRAPASIAGANLSSGFGREKMPDYATELWSYAGPKMGGRNPGCELKSGMQRIKIKFAELHSEPFTARIFDALGYNVYPTDFCRGLRIKYDRRFFTEFNSRREMKMRAGIFFIPLYRLNLQESFDPFEFIQEAVLRDGSTISAEQLRQLLFKNSTRKHPETDPHDFDPAVEERIDYLVTKEVNVQIEPRDSQSIGPWDFGALGHENLREVRGAGLIGAWLGWWDSRFENTRLRARTTGADVELKHYFSDLGGGLGISGGTFNHAEAKVEKFGESFTRRTKSGRFEIVGYEPVDETPAFREMTEDDARWMARKIAQLSEAQIAGALQASGFSSEEVAEFTRKLISRRAKLLADLGLR